MKLLQRKINYLSKAFLDLPHGGGLLRSGSKLNNLCLVTVQRDRKYFNLEELIQAMSDTTFIDPSAESAYLEEIHPHPRTYAK